MVVHAFIIQFMTFNSNMKYILSRCETELCDSFRKVKKESVCPLFAPYHSKVNIALAFNDSTAVCVCLNLSTDHQSTLRPDLKT